MGLLVFVAVAAVVVGAPLVWFIWRSKLRPGATAMVLVGDAAGEAEVATWLAALRSAGIAAQVHTVGDFVGYGPGSTPYSYEIWVRARDEARAREVLGL